MSDACPSRDGCAKQTDATPTDCIVVATPVASQHQDLLAQTPRHSSSAEGSSRQVAGIQGSILSATDNAREQDLHKMLTVESQPGAPGDTQQRLEDTCVSNGDVHDLQNSFCTMARSRSMDPPSNESTALSGSTGRPSMNYRVNEESDHALGDLSFRINSKRLGDDNLATPKRQRLGQTVFESRATSATYKTRCRKNSADLRNKEARPNDGGVMHIKWAGCMNVSKDWNTPTTPTA
ncbi:hypothetical protein ANO11243_059150 [Dothideomycetidae sp. 11243]|nr:hypothetical protein ANO11243_059150 [fungal sp. No.11243]